MPGFDAYDEDLSSWLFSMFNASARERQALSCIVSGSQHVNYPLYALLGMPVHFFKARCSPEFRLLMLGVLLWAPKHSKPHMGTFSSVALAQQHGVRVHSASHRIAHCRRQLGRSVSKLFQSFSPPKWEGSSKLVS